jgi:hypothetical protein
LMLLLLLHRLASPRAQPAAGHHQQLLAHLGSIQQRRISHTRAMPAAAARSRQLPGTAAVALLRPTQCRTPGCVLSGDLGAGVADVPLAARAGAAAGCCCWPGAGGVRGYAWQQRRLPAVACKAGRSCAGR